MLYVCSKVVCFLVFRLVVRLGCWVRLVGWRRRCRRSRWRMPPVCWRPWPRVGCWLVWWRGCWLGCW